MQYKHVHQTLFLEIVYLLEERGQMDDNTVSDQTRTSEVDKAYMVFNQRKKKVVIARTTRKQVERKRFLLPIDVDDDGVPSVVSACATSTNINV